MGRVSEQTGGLFLFLGDSCVGWEVAPCTKFCVSTTDRCENLYISSKQRVMCSSYILGPIFEKIEKNRRKKEAFQIG